ncbi:TfoX/Sxy family DNA transformation protein [Cronobacter dublinensis]|uniref:TfoX/Sxy family DNA transformation protein n=1 Tax=Cronobacter dublinensis TaxID=413497 RepID=UPI000CFAAC00|nr:TfoX/Sxy family DNA transformation protein [Cronobacter dublinensis]EKP4478215.1 TfoX/Sxy family DNA transformation protein [Cronobacter dublinensis]ELY4001094.1 TfoX/Sxy family DNA transformation protein [Cronobacter dublinensis]ELY4511628.1 TfoX/Sxy family DNA transformation protein [Cronobacter dublinensis]EMA8654062.1 TfoX/Sxy family DNA transformation protein [Cronobacter dublinensis]MDI7504923.1 TfoX/Sxy family DNA transformation protein [Cronobacter dublinensis]
MDNASTDTLVRVQNTLSSLGDVTHRSLFGGYSLAIDDAVFGMLAEGRLYLRASEQSRAYQQAHNPPMLVCTRRGRRINLNYYLADDALWESPALLREHARTALACAQTEKTERARGRRVKDLPNLNVQLEVSLWEAGIRDVETLCAFGAKECWLKLRKARKNLSLHVLYALQGAITGTHEAALPTQIREELLEWFMQLSVQNQS